MKHLTIDLTDIYSLQGRKNVFIDILDHYNEYKGFRLFQFSVFIGDILVTRDYTSMTESDILAATEIELRFIRLTDMHRN